MDGLLAGTSVLDFSLWRPGPYATQLLVEMGAEVIKVEPPGGDPMRAYPELFAGLHAGKRGIVLDLKREGDRATALDLACEADVVVEGYRPGIADRLGVGYQAVRAVNPSVVYCSVSGFGQVGPLAATPGHDVNYAAWAGVLAPDGGAPRTPAIPVADLAGGMAAALGVCAALVRRVRTGEGERVDLAMADVLATWTGTAEPVAAGVDPAVRGLPGYGTYATADGGYIALGVVTEDHFWRSLCTVLALVDLGEIGFEERARRQVELDELIASVVASRSRDELIPELIAADVPAAPVLDRVGLAALEHFQLRGSVVDEPWSDRPVTGYPIRFEHHPMSRPSPPPGLDEHRGSGFTARTS